MLASMAWAWAGSVLRIVRAVGDQRLEQGGRAFDEHVAFTADQGLVADQPFDQEADERRRQYPGASRSVFAAQPVANGGEEAFLDGDIQQRRRGRRSRRAPQELEA